LIDIDILTSYSHQRGPTV